MKAIVALNKCTRIRTYTYIHLCVSEYIARQCTTVEKADADYKAI